MSVLVTGGAGFIGSHTCVELLHEGYDIVIVDNLHNSKEQAIERIKRISNKEFSFYKADISDYAKMDEIFSKESIECVLHFAGYKAVGESVAMPMKYYQNNIGGTMVLLDVMNSYNVKKIIFSSSATVYGEPVDIPITEECSKGICTNPYGWTKWMIEQLLMDIYNSDPEWNMTLLRYFNPIGAHKSGLIGEDPQGIPNNLVPYVAQVASGKLEHLGIYGDDYDTVDGTGVRDYIHVVDLAKGHIKALEKLSNGISIYNLGTGHGYSVLQVVRAFEKVSGKKINCVIKPRRVGDVAISYCNPQKAEKELGWTAEYGIEEMCEDAWRWQVMNPNGYVDQILE